MTADIAATLSCDGQLLRDLARAGLKRLEENKDYVNALNVFPVPDGDTGTNMLLTMRSACKKLEHSNDVHAGNVAKVISRGALMGARGNSGVILSQIWRGFAKVVESRETFDSAGFAEALQASADTAYKGVMTPVEGTILTIIREAAAAAATSAEQHGDLAEFLTEVVAASKVALARTPDQLPILKQAGVVDSGGQGLIYIFEGMLALLRGEMTSLESTGATANLNGTHLVTAQELARPDDGEIENPYDVQFILLGKNLNVEEVRRRIDAMGDSTVVVGDAETIKVHIHVKDPGEPLTYGVSLGAITDVVVENMQEQMEDIISASGSEHATIDLHAVESAESSLNGHPAPTIEIPQLEPGQIGVVTVAPGDGLRDMFRSLGATVVIDGGQTNNPSTEELFAAIQDVPSHRVIVLPNNKNILMAAEAARDLSTKEVVVVPTRTVPQGISAMANEYQPDGELAAVADAMGEASADVATGEITRSVRDVTLDGVAVEIGQFIGIADGKLRAAGSDMLPVLNNLLGHMDMDERELVTLFYGAEMSQRDADAVAEFIESAYEDVEVEVISGGQPHYFYILGAE